MAENSISHISNIDRSISLSVEYRPISELQLNPDNPRFHSEKQIKQIATSIRTFGPIFPILIDGNSKVIAGHGRLIAARKLGLKEFPTIRIRHLTESQVKAVAIADNRLTENSAWDQHLLAEQLKSLAAAELDFSLEATGFEMGEIDLLIEGLVPAIDGKSDPADMLPESESRVQVTRSGDIWSLGRHRIGCGNSLRHDTYFALMESRQAAMVFTDPPYNVPVSGHAGGLGRVHHRDFPMAVGEMSGSEFTDFLTQVCSLVSAHATDGSLHYVFMDWRHMNEILTAGKSVYKELKALCIWNKGIGGMGSLYRSQHELIFVFKKGEVSHRNNIQLGQFGRYRTNVWDYPGINSFTRQTEEGNLLALHPTVKPVALVADAIMDCSARGDIVLDPFLGSGTTVIAAERTGRISMASNWTRSM